MAIVFDMDSLSHEQSTRGSTGEMLGMMADISGPGGLRHLRIHHERLPAGKRSSPMHRHSAREEFVYVLEGSIVLQTPDARFPVHAGQCVCLAARGPSHSVVNESSDMATLLVASAAPVEDSISFHE